MHVLLCCAVLLTARASGLLLPSRAEAEHCIEAFCARQKHFASCTVSVCVRAVRS